MTTTLSTISLNDILLRHDVHHMSSKILGVPYSTLKALIYPLPPYKSFVITKRNGSPRLIQEPRRALKELQYKALDYFYEQCGLPKPCVHGFTKDRSIVSNAKSHCSDQTQHLLNLDLEDFFPSITFYRVRGVLQKKPFELSHQVATVLAHLCTFKGVLPQGAPTSPLLSNLICRSMDRDLMSLAKRHRATYTRYADDLTFSFSVRRSESLPSNICSFDGGNLTLGNELQAIIAAHSFRINAEKTRLSTRLHRLEVTGITINEFPNVRRVFIDQIRGALNAWEKYGYNLAQKDWERRITDGVASAYEKRPWKRQIRANSPPDLKNVLWGKLLYVRMVRGKDDVIYTRLAERYNAICETEDAKGPFAFSRLPVELIVRNAQDAERAVFVVEWSGDYQPEGNTAPLDVVLSQGTAFAYKDVGLVTCDHVLSYSGKIGGVTYTTDVQSSDVINKTLTVRNPVTGASWRVKVVHRDATRDLAILVFDEAPPAHRHFSSMVAPMNQGMRGILMGFPNWSPGRRVNQTKADVLSCYARSALKRFEISTNIRQGNSGGPFVDESYRVAGVAQQGARQDAGNDECLCVTDLDAWIAQWKASAMGTMAASS
ncbi:MAG: trypsin-like peptidase domain-containing protein [Thiobacillus sp.]|nr:trypsin-like peptidase domain-containing protein [Thiobacillus sp.]